MQTQDQWDSETKAGVIKWAVRGLFAKLVVGFILFFSAGRLDWIWGWAYLGVFIAFDLVTAWVILPNSPGLLAERADIQEGTKSWDKILVRLGAAYLPMTAWVLAGLDARYGWTEPLTLGIHVAALGVTVVGYGLVVWAMSANPFFSTTVRIQTDRGHAVATDGPYRYVRHPGYAGAILFQLAAPLMLGSVWALVPMLFSVPVYVLRAILEDRTLQKELSGYVEYARQTPNLLLPGVW